MYFRDYRNKCGFQAQFIADKLGIKKDTLLAKERGDRGWTDNQIIQLCILYDIKNVKKVQDLVDLIS